ncbi:conserved virulence factor C family protein [Paenibacillus xerothermodurans]|uniref:Virulence factor n=1 Tax=Paenibacillus xerothermodurans TaxID=1977292 RepID=A0A2W1N9E9_PAEXE|nr:conserved virulence factor C family protein [Paenibacillus xerothermodurans]PZE19771.1 virulence factor [Paenibacillus xerothermodurans]
MKIVSIEPTPSPNTMRVQLDERLPEGVRVTYDKDHAGKPHTPAFITELLQIDGVRSVYHAADFIAVDRTAKADWQPILAQVREVLGGDAAVAHDAPAALGEAAAESAAHFGEVQVLLQHFRGIPLQVRVQSGTEQLRAAMPERFSEAAVRAAAASPNLIKERSLEDWGIRYGELQEVLDEVTQELDATYDEERLQQLVEQAQQQLGGAVEGAAAVRSAGRVALSPAELQQELAAPEWKRRYAALQQVKPSAETVPLLVDALNDEKSSVRRLATVYLGDVKEPEVLPYLYRALEDSSVSVRRTAGDTLSDIGDPAAAPAMVKALQDPNKLVRWRAARFLYEVGDQEALPALHEAEDEPEFEVRMQIKMAIERIEGGHAAEGSVWQQMTRRSQST